MTSPPAPADLFEAALLSRETAYAPYSRFKVGAAIRDDEGRVFTGCNVENAAYPVGTCAEAGAVAAMALAGGRRIVEIAVVGSAAGPTAPCGACRQRIREFGSDATLIHMADGNGILLTVTLADMLPHAFGPDTLARAESAPDTIA